MGRPSPFKRPAAHASAAQPPVKRQATEESAPQRPSAAEEAPPNSDKCALIMKVLSTVEGIPASVLTMLQGMAPHALAKTASDRHNFQAAVAEMVGEVLLSVEAQAEAAVKELQLKVDGCEEDRLGRQAALEAAEKRVSLAKEAAAKAEAEVKSAGDALSVTKKHLARMANAQAMGDEKLTVAESKTKRLMDAQANILEPTKSKVADDAEVKALALLGKDFGFDPSFMEAMPLVLKKKPEARVGFDLITLEQLEQEISKVIVEQTAIVEDGAPAKEQRKEAVESAQVAHDESIEKNACAKEMLNTANLEQQAAEVALNEAKDAVASFFPEAKVLMDSYDSKKAWLQELRDGALTAFKELTQI